MAEPRSFEEYLRRFSVGNKITGHGIGNVWMTVPCPFCAAPSFMRWELLQVEAVMSKGGDCGECGRSAKAIITALPDGGKAFEVVQTGGPDQPAWLEPKMRRVSA